MNFQCGKFHVQVGDPYPIWVDLRYSDGSSTWGHIKFSHKELCDLNYAVQRALAECRSKLSAEEREAMAKA